MKRFLAVVTAMLLIFLLSGCDSGKEPFMFSREKTVGKDIVIEDISDFYYTEENINYDAYYQRYRFYVENGKYMFFHETRERPGDYGWCTEEDTTAIGTLELTADQWSDFYDLVSGGTVTARKDDANAGDSGPWTYLYWKDDRSKYQVFAFDSYDTEKKFVEYCLSLVPLCD